MPRRLSGAPFESNRTKSIKNVTNKQLAHSKKRHAKFEHDTRKAPGAKNMVIGCWGGGVCLSNMVNRTHSTKRRRGMVEDRLYRKMEKIQCVEKDRGVLIETLYRVISIQRPEKDTIANYFLRFGILKYRSARHTVRTRVGRIPMQKRHIA